MEKHIHKYVRVKVGRQKTIWYKCSLPGCPHKIKPELVVGRFAICNKCNQTFVMDKYAADLAKPICMNCRTSKVVKDLAALFSEDL